MLVPLRFRWDLARAAGCTGVEDVWLFGSTARGTARRDSDIDLLYRPPDVDGELASLRFEHWCPELVSTQRPLHLTKLTAATWVALGPARHDAIALVRRGRPHWELRPRLRHELSSSRV